MARRRSYTDEFKREAVKLVTEKGTANASTSK
jgi:transposase-like protein